VRTSAALLPAVALLSATGTAARQPAATVQDALAECGIARSALSFGQHEFFGDPEVRIEGENGGLDDALLICAIEAARTSGYLSRFLDEEADDRAQRLWHAEAARQMQRTARAWLQERNLLGRLPAYDPARQPLADYAVALETMCAIEPGSALAVAGAGRLEVHGAMAATVGEGEGFFCLLNVIFASNLAERGISVGIIGREAAIAELEKR